MGGLGSRPLCACWQPCSGKNELLESYDYIIIGGGSAGACLAARLSEDPMMSVLLLEAGPDATEKLPHYPLAVTVPGLAQLLQSPTPITSRYDYHFVSTSNMALLQGPHPGRKIFQPRGYIVGGSSCLNYMLWVRGAAAFYDEKWGKDWSWNDVAPSFQAVECYDAKTEPCEDRGHEGPTYVMNAADWDEMPKAHALFLDASQIVSEENGHQPNTDVNPDYNNPHHALGVGAAQWNIKRGVRQSTAVSYLTEALRKRENLTISSLSFVTRLGVVDKGGELTASEVYFRRGRANLNEGTTGEHVMTWLRCAPEHSVKAKQEIVLCGGAIQSPQLLMLSGIGDGSQLEQHGIPTVVHLPEVGKNLQDHLFVPTFFEIEDESAFSSGFEALTGSLISSLLFTSSDGGLIPDVQFHLSWYKLDRGALLKFLFSMPMNLTSAFFTEYLPMKASQKPLCCLLPSLIQPKSTGQLDIYSSDPLAYPKADFNYLSDQTDVDTLVYASNLLRRIVATSPMSSALGKEVVDPELPGFSVPTSKEYAEAYVRSAATCIYHPVGTCSMGKVVDSKLKVKGVEGLRVADASVMPVITPGNTNWPTIMIGERAASMMRSLCTNREPMPMLLGDRGEAESSQK